MGVSFVQETTVFRDFGPLAGNTIRANLMIEPPIASLSSQTIDVDARFYQRLATSGVLALRVRGFKSAGSNPRQFWFGGNGEMRGYDYLQFVGNNAMFANAELRFPIIDAALTPIGVVGALRGVFFANIGGAFFSGNSFDFFETGSEQYRPIVGAGIDPGTGLVQPIYGLPRTIDGLRLKDGRASYGVGLQTFLLGFPLHIDWSWRTLFSREWEDALFAAYGGSHEFRKVRFGVWVGYDF
jgi:outer membrane protein assembly factor BamA